MAESLAIFSSIFSHTLYLCYLIFFSPYLLKLLSFLSPLCITVSLLFLSLLTTIVPLHSITTSKQGFLLAVYRTLLEKLRPEFNKESDELGDFEELELYKIVFETSIIGIVEENPVGFSEEKVILEDIETWVTKTNNNSQSASHSGNVTVLPSDKVKEQVKKFESLFNRSESDASKSRPTNVLLLKSKYGSTRVERLVENPVKFSDEKATTEEIETGVTKNNNSQSVSRDGNVTVLPLCRPVLREQVKKFESVFTKSESDASKTRPASEILKLKYGSMRVDTEKKHSEAFSQTVGGQHYLGSFGSMRKEKEWSRTLACKLFEERHSGNFTNGEERMDYLWESHETELMNKKVEESMVISDDEIGKLCCLQALKLSAGKMNLNVGRTNFIKIGKLFKGIGWFQTHVRRQGKNKGYK